MLCRKFLQVISDYFVYETQDLFIAFSKKEKTVSQTWLSQKTKDEQTNMFLLFHFFSLTDP